MKIFYWNLRRIANDPTQDLLRKFVQDHHLDVLCIAEPFVSLDSIPSQFWMSMNLVEVSTNDWGAALSNLWMFCKPSLLHVINVVSRTDQQVTITVTLDSVQCVLTSVYARTTMEGQRRLWIDLASVKENFVSGGAEFTWARHRGVRGNVEERLDRCLANLPWLDSWDSFDCCTLPRLCSDHNPIMMTFSNAFGARQSLFRFRWMWLEHSDFQGFVKQCWDSVRMHDCPLRVDANLAALVALQNDISYSGGTDDVYAKECELQANLSESLRLQELFLKEKSRLSWISEGDLNTTFFHAMFRARRARSSITLLRDGNQVYQDPLTIQNHIVAYYTDLFANHADYCDTGLISRVIPSLITDDENMSLTSVPSS
ncbi:PREDICTED: uncharacterized protein LOC101295596 [Fragaria vesca subsp. vesca]